MFTKSISNKIDLHIKKFEATMSPQKNSSDDNLLSKIFLLPLMKRTNSIIESFNNFEEERRKIFAQIELYLRTLNKFLTDKEAINQNGEIKILKKHSELKLNLLSSGEKQLLIFLTEIFLNGSKFTTFIADEPELSLHIDWQRELINSIRILNRNSQIIIATHSPDIVAYHQDKIINMENITYGS